MKNLPFSFYEPFLVYALSLSSYWFFFLKNNFFFLRKKPFSFDKVNSVSFLKKLNYRLMINFGLVFNFLYWLAMFTTKTQQSLFWWGHCFLSNSNLNLVYYIATLNLIYMFILFFLKRYNLSLTVEYVFSLFNLNTVVVLIFYANTLYTLIFFLELISVLVFYKFNVSKFWFNGKSTSVSLKFSKLLPKYYVNTLFFQYWSAFFSSILIFYALLNIVSQYGSAEWLILNFTKTIDLNVRYFSNTEFLFTILPLFFGIFFKLGLTPVHFYKIEVYKGLPLISILFYTTYYFFIFFIFFIYFFAYLLTSFIFWSWLFFTLVVLSGFLYLLSLLFDGYLLKSFFGYSTVINSLNLLLVAFFAF